MRRGGAMTSSTVGELVPVVFINYYEKDASSAQKLYLDLKAAALNPWIDKENLLPGQNISDVTMKAIKESDYFVELLSKISVNERGNVQSQRKAALEVHKEVPDLRIYFIPCRLDDVDFSDYTELGKIQYVDLFPSWEKGLERILQAIKVDPKTNRISNSTSTY